MPLGETGADPAGLGRERDPRPASRRASGTSSTTVEAPGCRGDRARVRRAVRPASSSSRSGPTTSSRSRPRSSASSRRPTGPRRSAATATSGPSPPGGSSSSSCRASTARSSSSRPTATSARCVVDGEQRLRLDPGARAARARRRARAGSTASSGRSRRRRSRPIEQSGSGAASASRYPVCDGPGRGSIEKVLRFGEGRRHEAAAGAGRVHRDARARVPGALRRRAAREDGRVPPAARRTARSSTTCSSRPTPPSARRACASPTSACSTSR